MSIPTTFEFVTIFNSRQRIRRKIKVAHFSRKQKSWNYLNSSPEPKQLVTNYQALKTHGACKNVAINISFQIIWFKTYSSQKSTFYKGTTKSKINLEKICHRTCITFCFLPNINQKGCWLSVCFSFVRKCTCIRYIVYTCFYM